MSCAGRRNSIGHSYLRPTFSPQANAPANSDSVKTNFWLLLTAKAAYPPKTLRSRSWMSWNSRSTLAKDSRWVLMAPIDRIIVDCFRRSGYLNLPVFVDVDLGRC